MQILHINAGLFGDKSVSTQLSGQVVARLTQANKEATVVARDVTQDPVAHLNAEILMAASVAEDERSEVQQRELAVTETLLEELFAADVVVIGAPMYNFGIPSQLKAWVDRIAQSGRTFKYTENGPQGLLTGKRAYIASARGGFYSTDDMAAMDHQESYLKTLLGFVGINDVTIVRAEGVNISDSQREESLQSAADSIEALTVS
jgi:FMN-dependent NADH-azoreductase